MITGYIAGLCGTDVSPDMIEEMTLDALHRGTPVISPIWARGD
jgi:hypothetical protein